MEKVLVIDDDRVSRQILANAVERLGYCVIQSGNGRLFGSCIQRVANLSPGASFSREVSV